MSPEQSRFVSRGSGENWTRNRNRKKLDEIALNPRMLVSVAQRDLSTTVLGQEINFPVMCAPAGGQCGSHPEGERATASAAGAAGTVMALPVGSGYSIEEVAVAASGPLWFQHIHYNDGITEEFLPRLKPAGYTAVMLTVDALGPFPLNVVVSRKVPNLGKMFGSLSERPDLLDDHGLVRWEPPNITWDRLDWLRSLSGDLPLVIKGIRNVEDALQCVEHGIDAIVVSNHGGRQLDHGQGTLDMMPEIVEAVDGKAQIVLDGGIQRGTDVIKAISMGADAVAIGKMQGWGLAAGGTAGLTRVLEILEEEIRIAMGLMGVTDVSQLSSNYICDATPVTSSHEMSSWVNMPDPRIK